MRRGWKFFFLTMFLSLSIIGNGNAQNTSSNDPYSIDNIFVSAGGKDPISARNNAITQAQRDAFSILLKKLSIDEGFTDNITADEINDMVHSEQITNEKIAGNNYSAIFNITFSESFVNSILGAKKIAKNQTKQESYLIFPVKIDKKKSLLWESDNDWKQAWEVALKEKNEPRIKIANGNIDDVSMLNLSAIENAHFNIFESILDKYKADVAIIAYFEFDEIENKVNINLRTIRKFQSKKTKLGFVNVNQLEYSDLLSKVIKKTIEYLNKPQDITNTNPKATVAVDIFVSNLSDWLAIKNRLENMNFIEEMKINSIARDLIKVSISYNKNSGDLIDLFAKNNFNLQEKSNGQYFMSLISSATSR